MRPIYTTHAKIREWKTASVYIWHGYKALPSAREKKHTKTLTSERNVLPHNRDLTGISSDPVVIEYQGKACTKLCHKRVTLSRVPVSLHAAH